MSGALGRARDVADEALVRARALVATRVEAVLPPLPPRGARVRVAAVGKAAAPMARVALERWRGRIERALVVLPDGADASGLDGAEVLRAAHPVPDARSEAAGAALLELARDLEVSDVLLALVSGGASALACAPIPGVSLEAEQALVRRLLASGLPITDVNLVRGHLSALKRGGLALRAYPARTLGVVLSDVLGVNDLETVGGAPTLVLPAEPARVCALLASLGATRLCDAVEHAARELPAEEAARRARRARTLRAAGPELLLEQAQAVARVRDGREADVLAPMTGAVDDEAARLSRWLLDAAPGALAITHGEPTVRLPPDAPAGGRLGRLVLRIARAIRGSGDDRAAVARASDGVDGTGGLGGAWCDGASWEAMGAAGPAGLESYDDVPAHHASGGAIPACPSGTNLLDLVVLARGGG